MKKHVSLKDRWNHFLRREARPLLVTALVIFAFRSAIADWNDVPTGSMKPTIMEGDRIFVNKLAYDLKVPFTTRHLAQWGDPQRGDVVVFYSPKDGKRLVKRTIGLPGDTIELRNEKLFVNGTALDYSGLKQQFIDELPAAEQPRHEYASESLGDHLHPVMVTPAVPAVRSFGPVKVPDGQFFMMGDNRDDSYDSRFFGCVKRSQILGRATAVAISLDHSSYMEPRWHRFLTALP